MSPGTRRAVGSALILVWLCVYIALAAVVGLAAMRAPWWGQALYFAVAGVAWALPLRPVFVWMAGPLKAPAAPARGRAE